VKNRIFPFTSLLAAAFCLSACGAAASSGGAGSAGPETPAKMTRFEFDGAFVQNRPGEWGVAFDSYEVEGLSLTLTGKLSPQSLLGADGGAEPVEARLRGVQVQLAPSASYRGSGGEGRAAGGATWAVAAAEGENVYPFRLQIDVTPLGGKIENFGTLRIFDPFDVFYVFNE